MKKEQWNSNSIMESNLPEESSPANINRRQTGSVIELR